MKTQNQTKEITLFPFDRWMVKSNLETIRAGADPEAVIGLLKANGYHRVAAAVQQTLNTIS